MFRTDCYDFRGRNLIWEKRPFHTFTICTEGTDSDENGPIEKRQPEWERLVDKDCDSGRKVKL